MSAILVRLRPGEKALLTAGAKAAGITPTELARKALVGVAVALAPNVPIAADVRDSDAVLVAGVLGGLHGGSLGLIGRHVAADETSPLEALGGVS